MPLGIRYDWGLGLNRLPAPRSVIHALQKNAHRTHYTTPEGLPELAEQIALKSKIPGFYQPSAVDVVVGPGVRQLTSHIRQAFPGVCLYPTPQWGVPKSSSDTLGCVEGNRLILTKASSGYKLTPDDLKEALRTIGKDVPKLLFMLNPINPTGQAYSLEEMRALANELKDSNTVVLADEIYSENYLRGHHVSFAQVFPKGTIRLSGVSKSLALGGWRVGWAVFPNKLKWLRRQVIELGKDSYTCANVPVQYAVAQALRGGPDVAEFHRLTRLIYTTVTTIVTKRLSTLGFEVLVPSAAWYFLLDFSPFAHSLVKSGIKTSDELVTRLRQDQGILMISGARFGLDPEVLVARMAVVDFAPEIAMAWAAREGKLDSTDSAQSCPVDPAKSWMQPMLQGLDALKNWLASFDAKSTLG